MAASSPFTVILDSRDFYRFDEGIVAASNTIYPGMLVLKSSGSLIPNSAAADVDAPIQFAVEDAQFNKGIDDAYAEGDTCYYCIPQGGARVYAWLETGGNVAAGAPLESNGAGYLQAASTGRIIAYAAEAVNNSGGGTGPDGSARIRAEKA